MRKIREKKDLSPEDIKTLSRDIKSLFVADFDKPISEIRNQINLEDCYLYTTKEVELLRDATSLKGCWATMLQPSSSSWV